MQPPREPLVIFPFQGSGASTERAPASFRVHRLPCCSCSRTRLGGALRNAAPSTHSSPQAKGVKDYGVAPPPCAQPRPCPARLGSPGPWRAVTRVALEARADQEPESLNIFHFLPERQPRRGQGLADNASGAVLPQPGSGGAERTNHWLPGGWCLGRERRAASEARLVLSVHRVVSSETRSHPVETRLQANSEGLAHF